jgi:hypothetical protein
MPKEVKKRGNLIEQARNFAIVNIATKITGTPLFREIILVRQKFCKTTFAISRFQYKFTKNN